MCQAAYVFLKHSYIKRFIIKVYVVDKLSILIRIYIYIYLMDIFELLLSFSYQDV